MNIRMFFRSVCCGVAGVCLPVLFSACQVDYDFRDRDRQPRVVVNALITPQETFTVKLHWSGTYTDGKWFRSVAGAEICLYENDTEVVRCAASPDGVTDTKFRPAVGRRYRLTISVPGYGDLSARTSVPEAPAASVEFVRQKGWYRHFELKELSVADDAKAVWVRGSYTDDYGEQRNITLYTSSVFVDQVNGANDAYEADDKGSTIDFEEFLRIPYEFCSHVVPLRFSAGGSSTAGHAFRIITASDAYDRYMRSRYKQELNTEWGAEENPFTEQITVYTNIDNGFGIFAGYNYYQTPEL